jgi:hypothetical protein
MPAVVGAYWRKVLVEKPTRVIQTLEYWDISEAVEDHDLSP